VEVTSIGEVVEGAEVLLEGRVRPLRGSAPLRSKLTERPCVYWDVRRGIDEEPLESSGRDFWVRDATGEVLVRSERLRVRAPAERERMLTEAADADYREVSAHIRELKTKLRETQGEKMKPILRERQRLAKVATLLCAVRAHARGNVHLGGSLAGQAKWIEKNSHLVGEGARSVELITERWEVALEAEQVVRVRGVCRREPAPPGVAVVGYRDRSDCLVMTPPEDGFVEVVDPELREKMHAAAKRDVAEAEPPPQKQRPDGGAKRPPRADRQILLWTVVLVGAAVALALLSR